MTKAQEAKKMADQYNDLDAKKIRMKDLVSYIVDVLLEDILVVAKRGQYDMAYKTDDMTKERLRLANLNEEEVIKEVIEKMKELGFHAALSRPYIHISWK